MLYCKVTIPKFKDEDAYLVNGQYKALISESTFYCVKEVIDCRKRVFPKKGVKAVSPRSLALRGFLLCPKCGHVMIGSASRGRHKGYYPYYHCNSTCEVRFKADLVNMILFERHLKQFVPRPGMAELFIEIVCDAYRDGDRRWQKDQNRILEIIEEQRKRMKKSMELLLVDVITASEYKQIKEECANNVVKYEAGLKELNEHVEEDNLDINGLAALAVENFKKLSDFYANADSDIKRAIISSIYPEKWFLTERHIEP